MHKKPIRINFVTFAPVNAGVLFPGNKLFMKRIESIADFNAELFIRKHFSNLSGDDRMVRAMRSSVKDTIKKALEAYDISKFKQ